MKKIYLFLLAMIMTLLIGCAKTTVTDVFRFEIRKLELTIGETHDLEMIMGNTDQDSYIVYSVKNVFPEDGKDPYDILEVNGSTTTEINNDTTHGKDDVVIIKGLSVGVVDITAYIRDEKNYADTIRITVKEETIDALQITCDDTSILVGTTKTITPVSYPNKDNMVYKYTSSNEQVATIDDKGVITGLKEGTVTIYVSPINDEQLVAQKEFTVKYVDATKVVVMYDNKEVDSSTIIEITKGTKYQFDPLVEPLGAKNSFRFTSSSARIASIDATGLLTAREEGQTNITITSADGLAKTVVKVKVVYAEATAIISESDTFTISISEAAKKLPITVGPENANQKLDYTIVSGNDVIQISGTTTKKVKGLKAGEAVIRVTTIDGKISREFTIIVS